MKMLLTPFIVTTLLLTARAADRCGDRCTSTQVCSDDGICVNKSDLVTCGAWHLSYYCHKGYECCFQGCMPVGEVCCDSIFYCPGGSTCCGSMDCCGAGTVCNRKGKCVLDKYSTRKSSTTISVDTRTPSTTARKIVRTTRARTPFPTESRTRYPTFKTTRWFDDYTTRRSFRVLRTSYSTFRWWHVIIVVTVVTVSVIVAAIIRNRRNSALNAPGYLGTGGMVLK